MFTIVIIVHLYWSRHFGMYLYSISKCLMSVSLRLVMNTCSCDTNAVRDRRLLVLDSEDPISHTHMLQETGH